MCHKDTQTRLPGGQCLAIPLSETIRKSSLVEGNNQLIFIMWLIKVWSSSRGLCFSEFFWWFLSCFSSWFEQGLCMATSGCTLHVVMYHTCSDGCSVETVKYALTALRIDGGWSWFQWLAVGRVCESLMVNTGHIARLIKLGREVWMWVM